MPFDLDPYVVPDGMARSVFEDKYSRRKPDGTFQTWEERVREVVAGNFSLDPRGPFGVACDERRDTETLAINGVLPFSGRHLQHGDCKQQSNLLELFTNCSTAMFSFMLFRLLLRGSGVGRDYSAATCRVNWDNMPNVRLVLDESHPDFKPQLFKGLLEPLRQARHKYDPDSEMVRWFEVDDSREGWSKVVEVLETAAWQEKHADKLFIFDFSNVRPEGSPIRGLQNRPASGPIPVMNAIADCASIKGAGMKPWKQAMFIDHYLAACVVWGGARRSARMATKHWKDRDVIEFIDIKRGGHLWSANNSILVDEEFWEAARSPHHSHARRVFEAAVNAAYFDKTGEPGFITVDNLVRNTEGMDRITGENYINQDVYPDLHPRTRDMIDNVLSHVRKTPSLFITNPCGEIVLAAYGGYCVIGEVNLARVTELDQALAAAKLLAKFLVRCNRMKCEYAAEVKRTNRIGVGLTGIHEFAWKHFGMGFLDLIDERRSKAFWDFIDHLRGAAMEGAIEAADQFGMVRPHTVTTIKPSGTVSKVMACTEGAHLPALPYYIRWVQYLEKEPKVQELKARGYPVKDVSRKYPGSVVVGYPMKQPIADIIPNAFLITADQTTPAQNFTWLSLLEKYWIGSKGNQVSYTLKYDARVVDYHDYMQTVLHWQPKIRCVAVMPQSDWQETARQYGYVPEEPISQDQYEQLMAKIKPVEREDYDDEALACAGGACPIEVSINA